MTGNEIRDGAILTHLYRDDGFGGVWRGLKWVMRHVVGHGHGRIEWFNQYAEGQRTVETYLCVCGKGLRIH